MNFSSAESPSSEKKISSKTRASIFEDGFEAVALISLNFPDMKPI